MVRMLSLPEDIGTLRLWPTKTREVRAVVIDLVIALVLVLLIGALSSVALAQRTSKGEQLNLQERVEAEQRLWDLGYWAGRVDGNFDSASRHALVAFQKVERRRRTGILTSIELTALRTASRPTALHGEYFHVEIDLERQVLFVIDEHGTVTSTLPVSTGNGKPYTDHGQVHRARTPTGTFKVQRKLAGWRLSSLGLLYYPSYIVNGVAIHGSPSIPAYPASHGCIRVPMFAAKELSSLLPVGTQVEIYHNQAQHLAKRLKSRF